MSGVYGDENEFDMDRTKLLRQQKQMAEMEAASETNLGTNKMYGMLLSDYIKCTFVYLRQFNYGPVLEKQLERNDLDTVCAYELYQLKKNFVHGDTLDYKHFINKE